MRLENFVDAQALKALYQPTDRARGLPASAYTEEFYELENDHLFPRAWAAVAVGAQIPNPGDVLPVQLGSWPVLLIRGRDGAIAAFLNICRHRGMRLVMAPASGCEILKCPWHSWVYDLDGTLQGTPNYAGWRQDGTAELAGEDIRLKKVSVGIWRDLIFVNIDGNAPSFEEHCRSLDAVAHEWNLGDLRFGRMWEHSYPGNWKTSMDGGIESYHLPWGHPQSLVDVQNYDERIVKLDGCYAGLDTRVTLAHEGGAAVSLYGGAQEGKGKPLPVLCKEETPGEAKTLIVNVFPTGIFVIQREAFIHVLFLPDSWNRTRVVMYFYYSGEAANHADMAQARKQVEEDWMLIMRQDDEFVRYVQANMQVRDRAGIQPLFSSYWEGAVHHFQKMVVEIIERSEATAS